MFNTLNYVKKLSDAGVSKEIASCSLEIWIEVMNEGFISKQEFEKFEISIKGDLKHQISTLRADIKQEIFELKTELKQDIAELRSEFKQDIAEIRNVDIAGLKSDIAVLREDFSKALHKQTILMGSMFAFTTTILAIILKA